jgi:hypothetical protein
MRCFRCFFFTALIGGAVLLLHNDAGARPSGPVQNVVSTPAATTATRAAVALPSAAAPAAENRSERGFLGVGVTPMSDQLRETFKVPENVGVMIDEVESESPAEEAGLRAGDVIVSFDGEEVASGSQLARQIRAAGANTTVAVGFYRKGRFRQEAVTLAPRGGELAYSPDSSPRSNWNEEEWEEWGENFGEEMAQHFEALGEEWEKRGEEWGEHGEEWGERWAEWGEQFGERWAEWGEQFGERMAQWGEQFGERFSERFENGELSAQDWNELGEEIERAIEAVDWDGLSAQIEGSLDEVDWDSLNAEIEHSLDSVDWEGINLHINTAIRSALRSLEEAGVIVDRNGSER